MARPKPPYISKRDHIMLILKKCEKLWTSNEGAFTIDTNSYSPNVFSTWTSLADNTENPPSKPDGIILYADENGRILAKRTDDTPPPR